MKYSELRNEIRDLGFEEDQIFSEYPDIFRSAITRACKLIATLIQAPVGKIDLNLVNLGVTTTAISEGAKTAGITVNGQLVAVEQGNIATYEDPDTKEKRTLVYINGVWQKTGKYDLEELSKDENGNVLFDSIERVVENLDDGTKTFLDYDLEQYKILVVSPTLEKSLTIFYKERILPVTSDTQDDYQIQVVYPCEPLVALLAAHYVWLDDDERKAILYWNEFDQLRQEIEAKSFRVKARVVGGYSWLK